MKLIEIQEKLLQHKLKVFTKLEFRRALGASLIASQKLLERYTKKGVLLRLKGGVYVLKNNPPSGYLIANKLYEPSYLSFETALSYYNLIPEIVYSYTSATTRGTREYLAGDAHYFYHKIKKPAFTGYRLTTIAGEAVLLAEKEKALADYLYLVFLKKKNLNDRLDLKGLDKKKLFGYIKLFKRRGMEEWVICLMKKR